MATQAAFAAYFPEGRLRQGPVLELGDDLLDDRVPPVVLIGLDGAQVGVGDERVVALGSEQLTLRVAVPGQGLEPSDPAHDQPAGHVLGPAAGGERNEGHLGDLGVGDPPLLGLHPRPRWGT
ncbi:hypothetical protein [Ornithinimicrobium flavum]|uniref:hypothetical protein n=1 Tax=Ornithinimicrobium flavum TaxID=1288636 RepID=UPI001EE91D11|nr:hypothetical protein [Ornithinimicrobium flavum]